MEELDSVLYFLEIAGYNLRKAQRAASDGEWSKFDEHSKFAVHYINKARVKAGLGQEKTK